MPPTTFGALGHVLDTRDSEELLRGTGGKRISGYKDHAKPSMAGTSLARDEVATILGMQCSSASVNTAQFPVHPAKCLAERSPHRAPGSVAQFSTCLPPAPIRPQPKAWARLVRRRAKLANAARDFFPQRLPHDMVHQPDSESQSRKSRDGDALAGTEFSVSNVQALRSLECSSSAADADVWFGRQMQRLERGATRPPREIISPPGRGAAIHQSPDDRAPTGKRLGRPVVEPMVFPPKPAACWQAAADAAPAGAVRAMPLRPHTAGPRADQQLAAVLPSPRRAGVNAFAACSTQGSAKLPLVPRDGDTASARISCSAQGSAKVAAELEPSADNGSARVLSSAQRCSAGLSGAASLHAQLSERRTVSGQRLGRELRRAVSAAYSRAATGEAVSADTDQPRHKQRTVMTTGGELSHARGSQA
eukprot:TRINITY_DN18110_c0_g1_i1.p1 TRINITY_DN18110_c0_g1~~TRINITY_DN18110_c0_g1_i1.p1  ORF type:complete len:420 (+),score=110.39 TRINITY_DN18110_c0_g1_i1:64-1323(+)